MDDKCEESKLNSTPTYPTPTTPTYPISEDFQLLECRNTAFQYIHRCSYSCTEIEYSFTLIFYWRRKIELRHQDVNTPRLDCKCSKIFAEKGWRNVLQS